MLKPNQMDRCAFTLVELLVVIAIIGILVALLLPAIQAAREAARRVQCTNHLKEMVLAMLSHETAHGFLPSGGWGFQWTGDPDRAIGQDQPGGWTYAILSYMEQDPLYGLGSDEQPDVVTTTQQGGAVLRDQSPVAMFACPSRRSSVVLPRPKVRSYRNSGPLAEGTPLDYCANAGGASPDYYAGPSSIAAAASFTWDTTANGPVFNHSKTALTDISDGTASTYLLGEKYIRPDDYFTGMDQGDDHGVYEGCGADTCRWCDFYDKSKGLGRTPLQDTPGLAEYWAFGSAHAGACNFGFCDGSVRGIEYAIDPFVHNRLGNASDGQAVSLD